MAGRFRKEWIPLAALLAAEVALGALWLARDRRPPVWDAASHAMRAAKSHHALARTSPPVRGDRVPPAALAWALAHPLAARLAAAPVAGFVGFAEAFYRGPDYPPLPYLGGAAAMAAVEESPRGAAVGLGLASLAALIVGTYAAARRGGGPAAALLAALLVASYPAVQGQSRAAMVDVPLAAAVAVAMAALLRADGFAARRATLALGVLAGAGVLVKQPFVVVLGPPIAIEAVRLALDLSRGRAGARARLRNARDGLILGTLVAAPWYAVYLRGTLAHFRHGREAAVLEGDPAPLSLESAVYYPRVLAESNAGIVLAVAAAAALLWLVFARRQEGRGPLLAGIAGAFVFFTWLHPNKDQRYFMPALPLLAIATAWAIAAIRPRPVAALAGLVAAAFAALLALESSFGIGLDGLRIGPWPVFQVRSYLCLPPDPRDYGHRDVLAAIARHAAARGPGIVHALCIIGQFDYHGGLQAEAIRGELAAADGRAPVAVKPEMRADRVIGGEPFYVVAAMTSEEWARALDPGTPPADAAAALLRAEVRRAGPIFERAGLPEDLLVRVFFVPGGSREEASSRP
jgi:hypothetical protein